LDRSGKYIFADALLKMYGFLLRLFRVGQGLSWVAWIWLALKSLSSLQQDLIIEVGNVGLSKKDGG
jgi:hypothetical protein